VNAPVPPVIVDPPPPLPPLPPLPGGVVIGPETFTVDGTVTGPYSAVVDGLRVRIVDKNVGGDVVLIEATTSNGGAYQATFNNTSLQQRRKQRPDLQARVFAGETFLGASEVRYNASNQETLNILLTEPAASALSSEHETVTKAISTYFIGKPGDLQETDER